MPVPSKASPPAVDQHVEVGVEAQLPGPGVQHQHQAWSGLQPGPEQFQEGLGHGAEEGAVELGRVLLGQETQLRRDREHQMEMRQVQEALGLLFEPALLGQGLALGAVPVAAGVVADLFEITVLADLLVPAEGGGTALADRREDAALLPVQWIPGFQGAAVQTDDIGDVEPRAGEAHRLNPADPPAGCARRRSGSGPPGCRSAWTGCCRAPGPPGSCAGRCHSPAGGWRRRGAAGAD
jgi:hypothetical protein